MPLNDDAVIEPSRAYMFTAPVGSAAPDIDTVNDFDPADPETLAADTSMDAWKYVGHTDLDEDFEADEEGGDSEVRGTRQTPALRERVEATTEYVGVNLVQFDADSLSLYHGGGTAGVGFFDAPDSTAAAELAVFVIYVDGTSAARRVGEYHPKCSVRRNGPVSREAEGFMRLPIRYTPLKAAGQPVTRWLGDHVGTAVTP